MTKSDKDPPDSAKPLAGGVRHDARGNAVWQWASGTARHAITSTSQLLRRLNVSGLSLEDEPPPKGQTKPAQTKPASPGTGSKPAAPARTARGFNPYDGAAVPPATPARNRPAVAAPARSSWWRRLLHRR